MQDSRTDHKFAQMRRRNKAKADIDIAISGHAVIFLTPYQIRVDGVLDLYPTSRLYHHIPTKERGSFEKAQEVVVSWGVPMSNKFAIRHAFPRACALCTVKIQPGADEHLHMQQHHTDESVTKDEILWLTPHEAVYGGRHYRPEDQSRPERRFVIVR